MLFIFFVDLGNSLLLFSSTYLATSSCSLSSLWTWAIVFSYFSTTFLASSSFFSTILLSSSTLRSSLSSFFINLSSYLLYSFSINDLLSTFTASRAFVSFFSSTFAASFSSVSLIISLLAISLSIALVSASPTLSRTRLLVAALVSLLRDFWQFF